MGCTASRRVANEDAVRCCRERRRHTRDAVAALRRLAASHSSYLLALRRSAAAISRFAALNPFPVSGDTPPALLHSAVPVPPPPPPLISPVPLPPLLGKARALPTSLHRPPPPPRADSMSPASPWNWEEFYPPSPPGSEFYDRLSQQRREIPSASSSSGSPSPSSSGDGDRRRVPGESDTEFDDRPEGEDEEEDRCSATGGSSFGNDEGELKISEGREPSYRRSRGEIWRVGEEEEASLVVVLKHRNLKEIAAALEEFFLKAAIAGEAAGELLLAGIPVVDRRQTKKKLQHSSSILSSLYMAWSSKPLLAVEHGIDDLQVDDWKKNYLSILDRLFAFEKKLYEQVKAREGAKIEYQRKLVTLQSQESKGAENAKLEKSRAAIQRLQSLILATSKAVSTTSSAIIKTRNDELAPQLVDLCKGFLNMWRSMNHCHEAQNQIVQQVRGLLNTSTTTESTDLHRRAARDLESAISDWQSSLSDLITSQKDHIHSIHSWLKLTVFQISSELPENDHYSSLISSELTIFCEKWKQAAEKLPDTIPIEPIRSFANAVHSIYLKQKEELKTKRRVELHSKELEKKKLALLSMERKYYRSYSIAGTGFRDRGFDDVHDPLAEKKIEVAAWQRKVEEEMERHTRAIWATKELILDNVKTGLPGLFQAIADFSGNIAEALEDVCCRRIRPW